MKKLYPEIFSDSLDTSPIYKMAAERDALVVGRKVFDHNLMDVGEWKYGFTKIDYKIASSNLMDEIVIFGGNSEEEIKKVLKKKVVKKSKKRVPKKNVDEDYDNRKLPKLRWYSSDEVKGDFVHSDFKRGKPDGSIRTVMGELDLESSIEELPMVLSGSDQEAGFHYEYYDNSGYPVNLYIRREVRGENQKFTVSFQRDGAKAKNYMFITENSEEHGYFDSVPMIKQILKDELASS